MTAQSRQHVQCAAQPAPQDAAALTGLRCCPHCDTLYRLPPVTPDMRGSCPRCHAVLIAPRGSAFTRLLALALTALILMVGVVFWPFLDLSTQGMHSRASVLDAIEAFAAGRTLPLSVAVGALIVGVPALRLLLLVYVLAPLVRGNPPLRRAGPAFRLADGLRPWSMAEIFLIGVAVALVKVAGLASVHPGPAFWALCGLVVVTVLQDTLMDKETVWLAIERGGAEPA